MDTRNIEKYLERNKKRKKWISAVTVLGVIASMFTNALLTNPVDAMTGALICSQEEHTHTNECYITMPVHVGCAENAQEQHLHDQTCYDAEGKLVCNKEEYVIIHTHDNNCYDKDGNLICGMPEVEEHIHDASCYDAEGNVICGKREIKEHREHSEECYTTNEAGERVLTCTYPIAIRHQHAMACYEQTEAVLICGKEEHVHTDSCYEQIEEEPIQEEATEEVPADSAEEPAEMTEEAIPTETVTEEPTEEAQTETIEENTEETEPAAEETITEEDTEETPAETVPEEKEETDKPTEEVQPEVAEEENTEVPAEVQEETNHKETEENTESAPTVIEEDGKKIIFTEEETDKPAETVTETAEENKEEVTEEPSEEKKDEEVTEDKKPEEEQAEDKKDTEDKNEEETEKAPQMPAVSFENADTDVVVTVTAEEGSFPAGTEMRVTPVAAEEVTDAVQSTTEKSVVEIQAVDISFWNGDEEIEPLKPINVVMKPKAVTAEADHTAVVHVKDEGETEVVVEETEGIQEEVVFDTPSFSVYAIVYTVDFHYEVNGNTYDYSIKGGTGISLRELLTALNVVSEEESYTFVSEITDVTFSNPELVDVYQIMEDITVQGIKDTFGIVNEYAGDLTEEEITENNNKVIPAGDWALLSKAPFDTEETMTITMMDGAVFDIKVTDENENPLGLNGQSFSIVAFKNGTKYSMRNAVSSTNENCLSAYTVSGGTFIGTEWTFEWTGNGKNYLIHDDNNRYIILENNKVWLSNDRAVAKANPISVISRDGNYSFVNKNNYALNIYGYEGFGAWAYSAGNNDFVMSLQSVQNANQPGTISTVDTSDGITINLFDYGPENQLDAKSNNLEDSNYYKQGLNAHQLKFWSYGTKGNSGANHFTGDGMGPRTGIVQDQLGDDNYPILNPGDTDISQAESLNYLFGGVTDSNVTAYKGLNHLFTKDENGYLHYSSDTNYAYYDSSNGNKDFKVYSKTFPEEGADNQYFAVGFFPFDDYNEKYNCIHGKNFGGWHGDDRNKEGHYNHHFGMEMIADFTYLPDGMYNGKPMTFHFSGDDDLWVFVDGVLIMDIGGIHNPVAGDIDFSTGNVTVHGAAQENLKTKYKRITGKDWDDSNYSSHEMRVFYMERGGMYSNLELTINLPTFKTLSLSKKLNGLTNAERAKYQNEVFTYDVYVNNELYNGSDTIRTNAQGEIIEQGFEVVNGKVSIKDGETVTIIGLRQTDTFYAAEENSLNMDQFEVPHAERNYVDANEVVHEEEISLTEEHDAEAPETVKDWKTDTYSLQNTEKVTFNNMLKEKDLDVEKKWNGNQEHPDSITFTVDATAYAEGQDPAPYLVEALKETAASTSNDKVFTLNGSNSWKTTIGHLPIYTPDGKRIIYTVHENPTEGYLSGMREMTEEKWNIDAVKLWPDNAAHTEVINVKLRNKEGQFFAGNDANGDAVFNETGEVYQLTPSNGYTYRFNHVLRTDNENDYELIEINDADVNTTGLVKYVREIIDIEITNTPVSDPNPDLPVSDVEVHKRIDALRDKVSNTDAQHSGEDLTDLYRLYLDYKINGIAKPDGVDLLFVIDHSGSMNYNEYSGNENRAPRVMSVLNGDANNKRVVQEFLKMNDKNKWAAVGFKGPNGAKYWTWGCYPGYGTEPWTGYQQPNAAYYDSEVLSGTSVGDTYTFGRQEENVVLRKEGENILTDYTAGFWAAEQFLLQDSVRNDQNKKVIIFISDGIPTLYIPCVDTLADANQIDGSYYYPDWAGGCREQTLQQFNNFLNDLNGKYEFGKDLELYTVGFGNSMQATEGQNLLKGMLSAAYGKEKDDNFTAISDSEQAAHKLKEYLRAIIGMGDHYSNVVIEDKLSNYVDLYGLDINKDPAVILKTAGTKVTMTNPVNPSVLNVLYENGAITDVGKDIIKEVIYSKSEKTIQVVFKESYEPFPGETYTLSFDVKTTDAAYTTYKETGYDKDGEDHVITGDKDTDYLGTDPHNSTSSEKEGFCSNESAKLTYTYNDENREKVYPRPVIQVFNADVKLLKIDESGKPLAGAEFDLYKDAYDDSGTEAAAEANRKNKVNTQKLVSTITGEGAGQAAVISTEKLKPGTYYLVETKAPDGYISFGIVEIVVSVTTEVKDGVTTDTTTVTASVNDTELGNDKLYKDTDGTYILKVMNTSGVELPHTGGTGTMIYVYTGGFLLILAGILYILKQKQQDIV